MITATKRRKKTVKSDGSINKAEEIRIAAKELGGKKVRPKDVIAHLATKGISVAPAQVSSTLKAAGYRRIQRHKVAASPNRITARTTRPLRSNTCWPPRPWSESLAVSKPRRKQLTCWPGWPDRQSFAVPSSLTKAVQPGCLFRLTRDG